MQKCTCDHCRDSVPLNDSIVVLGERLCLVCAGPIIEANTDLTEQDVERNPDPTVCVMCGHDGGSRELDQVAGLPICETCAPTILNRPFPGWIKASALVLAALVVLSLSANWRFVQANFELEKVDAAIESGEIHVVAGLYVSAAEHVPEIADLAILGNYWTGIAYLEEDNPREALIHLNKCLKDLPPDFQVAEMISSAESSVAFDNRDYHEFLRLVKIRAEEAPDNMIARLGVASALACLYVDTGNEDYSKQARDIVGPISAEEMDSDVAEYIMRIRHRLETRTILKPTEFYEQYPDGWHAIGEVE